MRIFCDFDGTITNKDSIIFLTEHFGAGPEYRESLLHAIQNGELSVFEVIERELATVKISWQDAVQALRQNVHVDPSFPPFASWCRQKNLPLCVLSSGMRPVLDFFIGHLDLPIYAHSVEVNREGWIYLKDESSVKTRILENFQGDEPIVYIGDGTSDVAVIPQVDRLYAKRYLAEYCQKHEVSFIPFESFDDIRRDLEIHFFDG